MARPWPGTSVINAKVTSQPHRARCQYFRWYGSNIGPAHVATGHSPHRGIKMQPYMSTGGETTRIQESPWPVLKPWYLSVTNWPSQSTLTPTVTLFARVGNLHGAFNIYQPWYLPLCPIIAAWGRQVDPKRCVASETNTWPNEIQIATQNNMFCCIN